MLITFKSKAAADVTMYQVHAKRLLDLLNKDLTRGVITAAETAHAAVPVEAVHTEPHVLIGWKQTAVDFVSHLAMPVCFA